MRTEWRDMILLWGMQWQALYWGMQWYRHCIGACSNTGTVLGLRSLYSIIPETNASYIQQMNTCLWRTVPTLSCVIQCLNFFFVCVFSGLIEWDSVSVDEVFPIFRTIVVSSVFKSYAVNLGLRNNSLFRSSCKNVIIQFWNNMIRQFCNNIIRPFSTMWFRQSCNIVIRQQWNIVIRQY
jgi:hypothetical protein